MKIKKKLNSIKKYFIILYLIYLNKMAIRIQRYLILSFLLLICSRIESLGSTEINKSEFAKQILLNNSNEIFRFITNFGEIVMLI